MKSVAAGRVLLSKVQDGCNNRCTFCVVTLARGESRSRSLREMVAEVQGLADEGVQEAVLTGVHLGSYGRDLDGAANSDLKRLVDAILRQTDIVRLRLSSLEPWELADGFFDLWRDGRGGCVRICICRCRRGRTGSCGRWRGAVRWTSYRRLVGAGACGHSGLDCHDGPDCRLSGRDGGRLSGRDSTLWTKCGLRMRTCFRTARGGHGCRFV